MFAARVKPDGTVLDPEGILLNLGTSTGRGTPSAAFDGKQFVVVWTQAIGIDGVHVSTKGTVLRRFSNQEFLVAPDAMVQRVQGRVLRGP